VITTLQSLNPRWPRARRYLLLVYKPLYRLAQNFSVCHEISQTNQSGAGDLNCGGVMYGCDSSCTHSHFECLRPNGTNDSKLEVRSDTRSVPPITLSDGLNLH
jgi:hypothetical protein